MPPMIACAAVTKRYGNGHLALELDRSRHRQGRDLRPARPQRRREDDADRRHLRHSVDDLGLGQRRRLRRPSRLSRRPLPHRPGPARDRARHLRDRIGDRIVQPPPVRPPARSGLCRAPAARPLAVGEARCAHRRAFGRHEAAGDDRQGAEPPARRAVSRRTDRRRRRQSAPRHVGAGAPAARRRRHGDPDHPLHRGGRGDGRPGRRDRQGPHPAGRGQGGADAQARQAAPHPRAAAAPARSARDRSPAGRSRSKTGDGGSPTASTLPPRTPACRRCCTGSPRPASISPISRRPRAASRTSSSTWSDARHDGVQSGRRLGALPLRTVAHRSHDLAERRDAGASPPPFISSCSAARSARASTRSAASATARSSCRG